jgi:hypothetical protein
MLPKAKIILIFFILAGLSIIHLASLLDDPDHFLNPKQDCPLCQADKTLVIFETDATPFQTFFIQHYIHQIHFNPVYGTLIPTLDSIRAPPSIPALIIS